MILLYTSFAQVGDPVVLVFTNGARGFLALPRPLFGSECDDNNAAGTFTLIKIYMFKVITRVNKNSKVFTRLQYTW